MAADAAVQAAASIPAETTGDVVHEHQNGHHLEHVSGLFYTAEVGLEGMKRLLIRLLQSPEVVFHLEPLRVDCTAAGAAAPASFAWND